MGKTGTNVTPCHLENGKLKETTVSCGCERKRKKPHAVKARKGSTKMKDRDQSTAGIMGSATGNPTHFKEVFDSLENNPEKEAARILCGASLVAQWLRIHLPRQETQVRTLVQEDPTCCGATKPVCQNY